MEYFRAVLRPGFAAVVISAALIATAPGSPAQAASVSMRTGEAPAITTGPIANLPGYDVFRPANLKAIHHKSPLVAWANGGCVFFNALWKPLFDAWVRAGFIVVAIGPNPSSKSGISTVADQEKIVDWAFSENARKGSPYHNRLDLKGIVAAGNSCGGVTAVQLAAQDRRVRAVFVLSGSSTLPGTPASTTAMIMSRIHVPIGYVEGDSTDISRSQSDLDYSLVPKGVPIYQAHRARGDHLEISTRTLPEDAEISTKWLTFSIYGGRTLEKQLLLEPCQTCSRGTWIVRSKNL